MEVFGRLGRSLRPVADWLRSGPGAATALALVVVYLLAGSWNGEISQGDTAAYFGEATRWAKKGFFRGASAMAFSPLYEVFFAWVQRFFPDALAATAVHRFLILLAGALASLLAARRMLPPAWAWLVAVWWIVAHAHASYEVHLFGYVLVALGAACAAGGRSSWWRGLALAILGADAVLVRNELAPAAGLFALCCAVSLWQRKARWTEAVALSVPGVLAVLLAVWLFSGNRDQLSLAKVRQAFVARNKANLVQVYPFGYRQRHTDWQGDPWHEGASLMEREFGQPTPNMAEALRAHPRAFLEHVAWNFRLLPAGLQYGLFGGYSGAHPPDFVLERPPGLSDPRWRSAGVVILWALGGWLLFVWWRKHRRVFLAGSPARWAWIFLLCTVPTALVSISTQRPRPSYIFPLLLLLMVFTALSARLVLSWARARAKLPALLPRRLAAAACAGLLLLLPPPAPARVGPHAAWLADDYRRLDGLMSTAARENRVLATNTTSTRQLTYFLNRGGRELWGVVPWSALRGAAGTPEFAAALERAGVTDLYLRDDHPPVQLGGAWQQIAVVHDPGARWEYWAR